MRTIRPYRIHWLCEESTPYHDHFFRRLAAEPEVELMVHFVRLRLDSHPWEVPPAVGFPNRPYRTVLGLDWHLLRLAVTDRSCFFIIAGWRDWTMRAAIAILSAQGRSFALMGDTPDLQVSRPWFKSKVRDTFLGWLFAHCSAILTTGQPGIRAFQLMGALPEKLYNCPFFVDLDYFKPNSRQESEDNKGVATWARVTGSEILFLTSGQLVTRKGFDFAIRAFARALCEIDGYPGARLLIAGEGPERSGIQALINQLELTDHIQVLGWLEPDQMRELLAAADVVVHAAIGDPFPVVVLEAMAMGKPILGSDSSGSVLDRVVDGVNGFVHRTGDVEQLAKHIVYFLRHPEAARCMGGEARRTAEQWPASRGVQVVKEMIACCLNPSEGES